MAVVLLEQAEDIYPVLAVVLLTSESAAQPWQIESLSVAAVVVVDVLHVQIKLVVQVQVLADLVD
jgi:hypothetical protein